MEARPTLDDGERARLENQLALTDLLIALSEESGVSQRAHVEQGALDGEALATALTKLAVIESSEALRKTERKRLLAALAALSS